MDHKIVCPGDSRKGGLVMLWKKEIKILPLNLDPMFIDVQVEDERHSVWRCTVMYGEFRWAHKYKTWERMRCLHQDNNMPWLLIGDLNEIQFLSGKEGGNPRPSQYMQAFQQVIDDCNLCDTGFVGDPVLCSTTVRWSIVLCINLNWTVVENVQSGLVRDG